MKNKNAFGKIGVTLGWLAFILILAAAFWAVKQSPADGGDVTVVCIETRNDADSTLLVQNGSAILIDAGEQCDAENILDAMRRYGVQRLDYFILTHGDADHLGGAQTVLSQISAENVIEPYCDETETLAAFNEFLKQNKTPVLYPTRTLRLHFGNVDFLVYPPLERHYGDENNYSLATLVQHKQVNMLFTGDALRTRSEELLLVDWPEIDLYHVPHHGRANSASAKLFEAVKPQIAVVTSDTADEAILQAAKAHNTEVRYTLEGDCIFISNGKQLLAE